MLKQYLTYDGMKQGIDRHVNHSQMIRGGVASKPDFASCTIYRSV